MTALHLLRIVCIALVSLTGLAVQATTYYIDSELGRDGATGLKTNVDGRDGPWRSPQSLANVLLFPGDRVLFRCGQQFEGPLRARTSDRSGEGHLLIGTYGNCADKRPPVITGSRELGLPETLPGGLLRWKLRQPVGQVQWNGKALPMARHPAAGWYIWPHAGQEHDPATALDRWLGGKGLSGGRVSIRTQDWLIEERRIVTQGTRLDVDSSLQYPLRQGVGVFVTGKPWLLDNQRPGWVWDDDTQTLTVRPPEGRGTLTWSAEEPLIDIQGQSPVVVQGLKLVDSGADALKIHADATVTIKQLRVERARGNGLSVLGSRYAVIEDNHIEDIGADAIFFAEASRVFVRRNTVQRIGLWGSPRSALAAINAHRTERAVIEDNLVDQSAYIGIRFSGDAQVRRNIVLRTCRVLSDCGAIYTWRRDPGHRPPASEIAHNTVIDVRGDTSVKFSGVPYFMGLYLDDFTNDTTLSDNLVVDAGQGMTVKGLPNRIERNRFLGTRGNAMITTFNRTRYAGLDRGDNIVRDNEVVPSAVSIQWPEPFNLVPGTPMVLDAGARKIAIGWVDWSRVTWDQVAPGCKPLSSPLVRLSGDLGQQSTGVVLDCRTRSSR